MTRIITNEQIKQLREVLEDLIGVVDCNCPDGICGGECTHATAVAALAVVNNLPEAKSGSLLDWSITPWSGGKEDK